MSLCISCKKNACKKNQELCGRCKNVLESARPKIPAKPNFLDKKSQQLEYTGYYEYLQSDQWKDTKQSYEERYPPVCFICGALSYLNLHHIRYENLGCERDEDLCWLCKSHHEFTHKLSKIHNVPLKRAHLILLSWYSGRDPRLKSLYASNLRQKRRTPAKKTHRLNSRSLKNPPIKRKRKKTLIKIEICPPKKKAGIKEVSLIQRQKNDSINQILFEYQKAIRIQDVDLIRQKRIEYNTAR